MTKIEIPVKKNEIYQTKISDLSHLGTGVAKINDYVVFVENVLPSDYCEIKIIKVGKKYGFGKLVQIIEPSPLRELNPERLCPVWDKCGGCSLLHMKYENQIEYKNIDSYNESPYHYRNKVTYPVRDIDGEIKIGFYKKNSHDIIESHSCIISQPVFLQIINFIKKIMLVYNITAYNEENHTGLLKNIFIRQGQNSKEIMIGLVFNHNKYTPPKDFINQVISNFPHVKSIMVNYNNKITNVALGKTNKVIYGKDYIIDTIGHIKFRISLNSFYQINSQQCQQLYDDIIDFAGFSGTEKVIDAYCGIGTIALYIAKHVDYVHGIEVVPQAIENAKENAKLNTIENTGFTCGAVEDVISVLIDDSIDTVIVDPPRKGLEPVFIEAIKKIKPKKIMYVSCNPKTLERDIELLADKYNVVKTKLYDFFPNSLHIESLVMLTEE